MSASAQVDTQTTVFKSCTDSKNFYLLALSAAVFGKDVTSLVTRLNGREDLMDVKALLVQVSKFPSVYLQTL